MQSTYLSLTLVFRIECRDIRYKIRLRNEDETELKIQSICLWDTRYSVYPQELECVLEYCTNSTLHVNDLYNYDYQGSKNDLVRLGESIVYPCRGSMRLENSTRTKLEADQEISVKCGEDGYFQYPEQWPQCSDDVYCGDPPFAPNFGYQVWMIGHAESENYTTEIYYR